MRNFLYIYLIFISLHITETNTKAAENIMIYKGTLSRTIPVNELEILAEQRKATGTLKNLMRITNQNQDEVSDLLSQEFDLPIVLTSKLLNSKIGNVIISRIGKIIYPNKYPGSKMSNPAIKAGVINAIVQGNGKLNMINFFKSYPNKNMAINYTALSKVINKVESMTDLVEFFTGSPLEKLKSSNFN